MTSKVHRSSRQSRLAALTAAALVMGDAGTALALGFKSLDRGIRGLPRSARGIEIHPFSHDSGLHLLGRGQLSFRDAVTKILRAGSVNPLVEMRASKVEAFGLTATSQSLDYRFYVAGIPLCGYQVRAHEMRNKSTFVVGTVPDVDPYEPAPAADWPDLGLTLDRVSEAAAAATGARQLELGAKSRCLYVSDGRLLPVWSLTVYADGLPYQALSDAYETIKLSPGFFDVDASAKVYPYNRLDAELTSVTLKGLTDDGKLVSEFLKTVVPTGYATAVETSHVYEYPTTDQRFDEVQVYAHAQTHFDFFKSLGFEWYGPKPLEIKIHIAPAGRPNNALFIPGSSVEGTKPSISIHDGDGIDLQNLVSDGDVVSHEFGHHVIYNTLRTTDGESLVLHEGLADFFAFSRTGDACLGESICPKGSGACILENQCLRTAANALVYNDQLWNEWAGPKYRLGHLHGQLVSGLLWDLRTEHAVPAGDLATLVLKAVSLFKEDSGLRDFMLAMFTADLDSFAGKYATAIHTAGTKRGLEEFFADVTPGQPVPALAGAGGDVTGAGSGSTGKETKKESKSSGNPFGCGTVAYNAGKTSLLLLGLLLCIPLVFAARPVPARTRSRRRPH